MAEPELEIKPGPEIEKPPEVAEKPPEVKIETEKEVKELGDKTIEDTEKGAEEIITSGKEMFEGTNENIGLDSETVQEVKTETGVESELQTVQNEIQELTLETQDEIKEVLGEKPVEEKVEEAEDQELIEALEKECSEPIPGAKDMPVYPFKDLMKKFKTTDLKAIIESEEYKKMISEGFILGSGEQRVYYGEKPGRTPEGEPTNVHLGVDYMVKEGTEVSAVADGEVVDVVPAKAPKVGRKHLYKGEGGFGNMILIKHRLESGQEVYSLYGHLGYSKEHPKVGDTIKKDQVIGKVGKSFSVENGGWPSHLHFSILKEREATAGYGTKKETEKIIDPLKVFKKEEEERPEEKEKTIEAKKEEEEKPEEVKKEEREKPEEEKEKPEDREKEKQEEKERIIEVFKAVFSEAQDQKEKVERGEIKEEEAKSRLIEFIGGQSKIQEYLSGKDSEIASDAWESSSEDEFISKETEKFGKEVSEKIEQKFPSKKLKEKAEEKPVEKPEIAKPEEVKTEEEKEKTL